MAVAVCIVVPGIDFVAAILGRPLPRCFGGHNIVDAVVVLKFFEEFFVSNLAS